MKKWQDYTDDEKVKEINSRQGELERIRSDYEPAWDDIIEFVNHSTKGIRQDDTKGKLTGDSVYDSTAIIARNLLSDGLNGYLVSPAMRWFSLKLPNTLEFPRSSAMRSQAGRRMDDIPEIKRWLEDCEDVMYSAFVRSNFYDKAPNIFAEGCTIGTVDTYTEADLKSGRIIFSVPHIREVYISANDKGYVDVIHRKYKVSYRNLTKKFSMEELKKADPNIENKYKNNPFGLVEVIHAVFPREDYDPDKIDNKNKPVASCWVYNNKLLSESGYTDSPHIVWRWRVESGEEYGRSCAWDAMVDIRMSNQMGEDILDAADMAIRPPYIVPDDLRGRVQITPRGRTYVTDMNRIPVPMQSDMRGFPFSLEREQKIQATIESHFHTDFFLMLSRAAFQKTQITATQVLEMQGEKAAVLGARIGALQTEFLNPVIDRIFNMERRAGRIPPPPDILQEFAGANIEVDYLGPLAQAQRRLFKTQSINAAVSTTAPLIQFAPEIRYLINWEETARELLESNGMPQKCINPPEIVKQMMERDAKAAQQQQALAGITDVAKVLPAAGKAVEPNSPLDMLTGGGMGGE